MNSIPRPTSRALRGVLAAFALMLVVTAPLAAQPDLSNYVAIGDSLTAGFASGGLVDQAQQLAYPVLIHQQANGSAAGFEIPSVSAPGIPALMQLRSLVGPIIGPASGMGFPTNLTLARPYNNLGVPGADVNDVLSTVSDNGGLHDLILRGLGTQLQQALAQQPTFATVWIGNNDVLGAVITATVIEGVTVTPVADFEAKFRQIISTLAGAGVPMAIANLPSVTAIPFATTLPAVLLDANQQPVLVNGSPVPLIGSSGPLVPGQDFLTLNASQQLASGRGIPQPLGTGEPLTDDVVLTGAELAIITARVNAYNNIIATVAGEVGAALVDVNGFFNRVAASGIEYGGVDYDTSFLTGGLFSYDGVHGTAMGYAVIANEFISAINQHFGGTISPVDLGPFVFGPAGNAGTGLPSTFSFGGEGLSKMRYSKAADEQLRWALDLPDRKFIRRWVNDQASQTRPADPNPNDSGNGNANNGNGNTGGGDNSGNGAGTAGNGGNGGNGVETPTPRSCHLPPGHGRYCVECGPCMVSGEGDCDHDSECGPGLRCNRNVGADYGFRPNVDVCTE